MANSLKSLSGDLYDSLIVPFGNDPEAACGKPPKRTC